MIRTRIRILTMVFIFGVGLGKLTIESEINQIEQTSDFDFPFRSQLCNFMNELNIHNGMFIWI